MKNVCQQSSWFTALIEYAISTCQERQVLFYTLKMAILSELPVFFPLDHIPY
jgi:hypothetical protein